MAVNTLMGRNEYKDEDVKVEYNDQDDSDDVMSTVINYIAFYF